MSIKKSISRVIAIGICILLIPICVNAEPKENSNFLRQMGFDVNQEAAVWEDKNELLRLYSEFGGQLIDFHNADILNDRGYFVICLPKEGVDRLENYLESVEKQRGIYDCNQALPIGLRVELLNEDQNGILRETSLNNEGAFDNSKADDNTRDQISSSELSVSVSISNYSTVNNLNTKLIRASFNWLQNPFYRLTDKIGVSYSHSWAINSSMGGLVYQCYGESTGNLYSFFYYDGQFTAGTGVAYESIDIKDVYNDEHTVNHSGWVNLYVQHYINQTGVNTITNVLAKYYHKKLGVSGSLTLSPTPSISITNSSSYDWRQRLVSFSWVA